MVPVLSMVTTLYINTRKNPQKFAGYVSRNLKIKQ